MKRASYRAAIDWIALNDSAGDSDRLDPGVCAALLSAVLVADLFDVEVARVGADIVRCRHTLDRDERATARFIRKVEAGEVKDLMGRVLTLDDIKNGKTP